MKSSSAFLVLMLGCCTAAATAQSYTVTDLGTLHNWNNSSASGINNSGLVVGTSNGTNSPSQAFLWSPSTGMHDLGTLGGSSSSASGINDAGTVVGCSTVSVTNQSHAFVWNESGGMHDLGALGEPMSCAYAINNVGQVVGIYGNINIQQAFIWSQATGMQSMNLGAGSYPVAINDSGQVAGSYYPGQGYIVHGFLWSATGGTVDLGTLGRTGSFSFADGINSAGTVVGATQVTPVSGDFEVPFVWTSSVGMVALPSLVENEGGSAFAINSTGQIVGNVGGLHDTGYAVMWDTAGNIQNLNFLVQNSPLLLEEANAINDSGQIVGRGRENANYNQQHAFLLTPITQ